MSPTTRPTSSRSLGYRPELDGVRAVAWFAVFMGHAGLEPIIAGGQVAMFVFFGLSGFLITTLLVTENDRSGRIALGRFYARRSLRLVPALVAFLAVWLGMVVLFGHHAWMTSVPGSNGGGGGESVTVALQGVGAGLFYLTNWLSLFNVFTGYVPLGHLWSLAVEEQFYLLWAPLLILLLTLGARLGGRGGERDGERARRRARVVAATGAGLAAVGSFVDVVWLHHAASTIPAIFFGTDARAGAFLVGGALGVVWSSRTTTPVWWRRASTPVVALALALIVWSGWVFDHQVSARTFDLAWVTVSLAAPLLVVAVLDRPTTKRSVLSNPVLTYVGRRSYGLYLWHYVWLTWMHDLGLVGVVIALAATFACAELSWRLVEAPFLRLKARYEGQGTSERSTITATPAEPPEVASPREMVPELVSAG